MQALLLAHLLLLYPTSLCNVVRLPYSKILGLNGWRDCPACWQSLASWRGLKKTPQPPSLEGDRCSFRSSWITVLLKLHLYHTGLIISRLFKKPDKDMLMQYILRLFTPWMRFSQFANRVFGPVRKNAMWSPLCWSQWSPTTLHQVWI